MRNLLTCSMLLASISVATVSRATIVGVTPDASFASSAYTVSVDPTDSYIFSAYAYSPYDILYRVAALQTTGTAAAYGGGFIGNGSDYTSYSAGSATPANNFGGAFITAPTARPIDYSLADTYVALQFGSGANTHYGYAEVAGTTLIRLAYNDVAGGSITTGDAITAAIPTSAVPEPASWAFLLVGLGLVGGALRRRRVGVAYA